MLITLRSIVFSPTKYRTFAHQSIVLLPTSTIVLSPTTPASKPSSLLDSRKCNYARASLTYLTFLTQNLEGALPPLQTTLQEGKSKGMRASTHAFIFLVAVTTKPNNPQGFSLNGFPPAARAPPIYRTAQARQALDRRMVLQLVCSYAEWRHLTAKAVSCHYSANLNANPRRLKWQ